MNDLISSSLIKVLKKFGVVGIIIYIGGLVLLMGFIKEENFKRQIMLATVGVIFLSLSIFIAYFRLKIQKDREKSINRNGTKYG